MSTEDIVDSREIYDAATRSDVLRLHEKFPAKSLETCYYWYLYHHCDYETTTAQFTNGLSKPCPTTSTLFPIANTQGKQSYGNLGVFPAEIWQIVSAHLDFNDLCEVRLTSSALADIAAESLVKKIRFDLSFESLERLRSIAAHEHLRMGVKTIAFESVLLQSIGCVHAYSSHYDLEHHMDIKPQPPPEKQSTPQARRLYARNLVKFEKELELKYARYRKTFEAQERLLNGPKEHLFECIDRFPNLEWVILATDTCRHLLSKRFTERYAEDCAIPLVVDPTETTWELQNTVRPGIKLLSARPISTKFFNGEDGRSKKWLQSIFRNLDDLCLEVRDEHYHQKIPSQLTLNNLSYAISQAKDIKRIWVKFITITSVGHLSDIIPKDQSFPKLHSLNVDSFTATEEEVMKTLQLQPALRSLSMSDVTLSKGEWRSLLRRMRHGLNLSTFYPGGVLEDSTIELVTEHHAIDAWRDRTAHPLADAIDFYVTDNLSDFIDDDDGEEAFEDTWNPVTRFEDGDFASWEELVDEFGPIDSDSDDDLGDIPDVSDDSDNRGDDESDDESMHTANEAMSADGDDSKDVEHANTNADDFEDELPVLMDVD